MSWTAGVKMWGRAAGVCPAPSRRVQRAFVPAERRALWCEGLFVAVGGVQTCPAGMESVQ